VLTSGGAVPQAATKHNPDKMTNDRMPSFMIFLRAVELSALHALTTRVIV
jgi:hypothetical protein